MVISHNLAAMNANRIKRQADHWIMWDMVMIT